MSFFFAAVVLSCSSHIFILHQRRNDELESVLAIDAHAHILKWCTLCAMESIVYAQSNLFLIYLFFWFTLLAIQVYTLSCQPLPHKWEHLKLVSKKWGKPSEQKKNNFVSSKSYFADRYRKTSWKLVLACSKRCQHFKSPLFLVFAWFPSRKNCPKSREWKKRQSYFH